jgi:cytochrome c oxidase assembly factor CtaG
LIPAPIGYDSTVDVLLLAAAGLAFVALPRQAGRGWLLAAAYVLFAVTIVGPLDDFARRSLVGHMIGHLAHTDLVAPLVLLSSPWLARRFRPLPPLICLFVAIAITWGVHLSPLFELSLEDDVDHALVHVLFLLAGLLMWAPVFDGERLSHPARLLFVFVAMPLTGLLGFVLHSSRTVLYPHYAALCGSGALEDQQHGAELMWVGGSMVMFVGFMVLAIEYARQEARVFEQGG